MILLINGHVEFNSFQTTFLEALSAAEGFVDGDGTGGLVGRLQGLPLKVNSRGLCEVTKTQ